MKILAAEDNLIFQSMLRNLLMKWGYDVVSVGDGLEAWQILQTEDAPRLAILDWMMPGMDGVEVCRRLRASNHEPYIYTLLLTARTESVDLVQGMEAGADDYLRKPLNTMELRARLRAGRRIVELQEQLLMAREALRQQATHDGLTGLLNRSSIMEILHKELARSQRENLPLSVLMIDLDHFKQINDQRGHLAGDAVLREASARMKSAIRRYDAIGRYGGEEFLVVLPGCDAAGGVAQAERLRLALATRPFPISGQAINVTCSIGCSLVSGVSLSDPDCLVREADEALYVAKANGRNRVESSCAAEIVAH
ncbi:MAG TPA: diguanylate cyclase [Bryobacteraceae bacterium]|jgi:diguanylate cyclase (GGDEF)-like protein|nr:diguanylate cyclase [Bryobacteraceae bacterium]